MKNVQPNKTIETNEPIDYAFPDLQVLDDRLKVLAPVYIADFNIPLAFSVAFRSIFMAEQPNYEMKKGQYGATRSNWTYHTALAIAQASRMLNMVCRFEAMGKRDAIIQSPDEPPVVVLAAEWEWDYEDVFGNGKEIDKLLLTCKENEACEGFLLVYCPDQSYVDYIERVSVAWLHGAQKLKDPPTLFLHTIVFTEKAGMREFDRLRTVQMNPTQITVWNDLVF